MVTVPARERILAAAIAVMRTRGVAAATTRAIAAEAGVSEALIYRYFRSKVDVLRTAVREHVGPAFLHLLEELPGLAGTATPAAHLERIGLAAMAYYHDLIPLLAALFSDNDLLAWYRASLLDGDRGPHRAIRIVGEYVRAEQDRSRIAAGIDPMAAAQALLGAAFQHVFFALTVGEGRLAFTETTLARSVAAIAAPPPQGKDPA